MEHSNVGRHSTLERLEWIDFARAVAILCVVMCHAVETIYSLAPSDISTKTSLSKLFIFISFTVGRLGVPLFLFISGFLFLDREYDTKKCLYFWKHTCLQLFITFEIWVVIYNLFLSIWNHQDFSFISMFENMVFMKPVYMIQIWYIPMILGMYIFFPFVANALRSLKVSTLAAPIIIIITVVFLIPTIIIFLTINGENDLYSVLSTGFSGGYYGIYLIIGYLVKKQVFKRIDAKILIGMGIISFVCAVLLQLYAYQQNYKYTIWYDNIFLFTCSISVFEMISRIKQVKHYNSIKIIANYSFSVFLIHAIFCTILRGPIILIPCNYPIKVFLLWFLSVIISIVCGMIISRIPT